MKPVFPVQAQLTTDEQALSTHFADMKEKFAEKTQMVVMGAATGHKETRSTELLLSRNLRKAGKVDIPLTLMIGLNTSLFKLETDLNSNNSSSRIQSLAEKNLENSDLSCIHKRARYRI